VSIDRIVTRVTRVNGVRMASLCSRDGIVISSESATGFGDTDRVAAMSAEIGRAVDVLTRSWDGKGFRTAVFEASQGKLVIAEAGKAFVAVLAEPGANLGLLHLRVEEAAGELREVISPSTSSPPASGTPSGVSKGTLA